MAIPPAGVSARATSWSRTGSNSAWYLIPGSSGKRGSNRMMSPATRYEPHREVDRTSVIPSPERPGRQETKSSGRSSYRIRAAPHSGRISPDHLDGGFCLMTPPASSTPGADAFAGRSSSACGRRRERPDSAVLAGRGNSSTKEFAPAVTRINALSNADGVHGNSIVSRSMRHWRFLARASRRDGCRAGPSGRRP